MVSLVIVFAVLGLGWFIGIRYAVANVRWFHMVRDQVARETGQPWSASRWPRRTRVFGGALWRALWRRESSLFTLSPAPEIELARQEAVRRLRIYVRFLAVFAAVFPLLAVIILAVLAVRALA